MRPLFFVAVVAMMPVALPAHADTEQWWVLYRSDPSSGVLDCKRASPVNDFVTMSARGLLPQYVYHDGSYLEIVVVAANGQEVSSKYFHSLDACQAQREGKPHW